MATSTLDATVGGASSNTYATLAEADQFHEDRVAAGTTWSGATDANKNIALLWAAELMESLIEWTGAAADTTQRLKWPRSGMLNRVGTATIATNVIPDEIKNAQAEYARQLLVADRAADSDIETQGIKALKAGPVELRFKDSIHAKVVPDAVVYLLPQDWVAEFRGRASGTRELMRA